MASMVDQGIALAVPSDERAAPGKLPRFCEDDGFGRELRRRVDAYFRESGKHERDVPAMLSKSALVLGFTASVYVLLVFFATAWWQTIPLAILMGLSAAAIGFNIQHDGGHRAYSNHHWLNVASAATLDLIGASSYMWRWKHGLFHHQYVNLAGHDADIDLGIFGRLSPQHRLRWYHRWQHLYLWPLYGFLALKWWSYDDVRDVLTGRLGSHKVPRPARWELAGFLLGKAVFLTLTLVVPLLLHPVWPVLFLFCLASLVLGTTLSVVFQLAHVVEEADFPAMPAQGSLDAGWAAHQVRTTVDFCRGNPVVTWLVGGLNFQIEHHLFPRVCHIHYPAISKVVERTCRDYGVAYREHRTFLAGMGSHYRWLRHMGRLGATA
jgi:linoleoyl-CoA desaturase